MLGQLQDYAYCHWLARSPGFGCPLPISHTDPPPHPAYLYSENGGSRFIRNTGTLQTPRIVVEGKVIFTILTNITRYRTCKIRKTYDLQSLIETRATLTSSSFTPRSENVH